MNIFQKVWDKTLELLSKVHWKPRNLINPDEQQRIRELLVDNYYVILTRRKYNLSGYLISIANFFLTGKFAYWSHALMNLEDEVKTDNDFLLIEALGTGVQSSPFAKVFDVNGAVLLKPKNMTIEDWTAGLSKARTELGKPYDNLFDLKNDNEVNCVELVRLALKEDAEYQSNFSHLEAMIKKYKNLTPQMFYDCPDFEVVYEVRR